MPLVPMDLTLESFRTRLLAQPNKNSRWYIGRAPARLDVLGGIADYSGSVVLESTLACGTFAAATQTVDRTIHVTSMILRTGDKLYTSLPIKAFFNADGSLLDFDAIRETLSADRSTRWAAYASGCLYVLLASGWLDGSVLAGLSLYLESDVPIGAGVSSSASLEVATMSAVAAAYEIQMDGMEIARLCQIVENRVVGAPCGIMDQVTCSLGQQGKLLSLECQPHNLLGYVDLPRGWALAAIDSGVKHSVGGAKYRRARTGAFMGLQILRAKTGRQVDYLCQITPEEWDSLKFEIPEQLTGKDYIESYKFHPDPLSIPIPDEVYNVRLCAEHPILENRRVADFQSAFGATDQNSILMGGELMYDAHASYSNRVDLGCDETDRIVALCREAGPEQGLFGAKITGGGSGGCVAVLMQNPDNGVLERIVSRYTSETNRRASILTGSSMGGIEYGVQIVDPV